MLIYLVTVLWYTVLNRSTVYHSAQFELFWSYRKWIAGDTNLGNEIMANIAMFVPFGFLTSAVLPKSSKRAAIVLAAGLVFSLSIETLQLYYMRGLFEWDDLVSNTIGTVTGIVLYRVSEAFLRERYFHLFSASVGIACTLVCLGVFINGRGTPGVEADVTSRAYCFQIDEAEMFDGKVFLSGFAFRYGRPFADFSLVLRSGKDEVKLETSIGDRPDVNAYFSCDYDYTLSGFTAIGEAEKREYEVMIKWPWSFLMPTGVFVSPSGVRCVPEKELAEPEGGADLDEIVKNGVLRVYRPDYHCWVYQKGWSLYWIADKDFNFEEDGRTYIQYQLYTTQTERLPEKRLTKGHLWDNIGGYFEKYELKGDFGRYRVMKRDIPDAYSVTSIVTGYYKNEEWIWKNYYRPYYPFGEAIAGKRRY